MRCAVLWCLLALAPAGTAQAQEPGQDTVTAAAATEPEQEHGGQAAGDRENTGTAGAEREPTPEELTPDTFDPTEKVSEDLPVAFPVDI